MQAEDAGVGVISHEYGHDLGLPDLYDTSGAAESDVDFWDLMSSGSHTGPLFQTIPVHMGLWDKYVLGWVDPETFGVGSSARDVKVGQTSRTPKGTEDGIRVNLPQKTVNLGTPHSGENMWYSNHDQSWADVKLSRTLEVPAGTDVRFWSWDNYDHRGAVGLRLHRGLDRRRVHLDPARGPRRGRQRGLDQRRPQRQPASTTAASRTASPARTGGEWRHDYVNLTPYAGSTIGLRLRYATDAAFEEPGWFADDFEVTADGATAFTDDVESGADGWTAEQGSFTDTTGAGWIITSGTFIYQHYYLAEWRNYDGFDEGLRYAYDTTYLDRRRRRVAGHPHPLQRPGHAGLVPRRPVHREPRDRPDLRAAQHRLQGPAADRGQPLRPAAPVRRGGRPRPDDAEEPAVAGPVLQRRLRQARHPPVPRVHRGPGGLLHHLLQRPRPAGRRAPLHRRQGWYPGLELRGEDLFFRDIDASVVVPSKDNRRYTTRIVDETGTR